MAKLFASEMAERVTSQGLQIHGGAGYTTDFAVERYWRDARLTTIFEGISDIQKRVISITIREGFRDDPASTPEALMPGSPGKQ